MKINLFGAVQKGIDGIKFVQKILKAIDKLNDDTDGDGGADSQGIATAHGCWCWRALVCLYCVAKKKTLSTSYAGAVVGVHGMIEGISRLWRVHASLNE